jgi:hypothetical protein
MFTASDDDWQSYVPRIFPSHVWRIFEIAAKVVFAMLF